MTRGSGRSPGEGIGYPFQYSWASLVAQLVKNPPAMWETWFNPWAGMIPRRERLPTPVFWPENSMDCTVHGVAKRRTKLNNFHLIVASAGVCALADQEALLIHILFGVGRLV